MSERSAILNCTKLIMQSSMMDFQRTGLGIQAQEASIKASESSLKLKNDFLTSVSHELRTPMNAIMGGLQVAQSHQQERLQPPF